MPVRGWILLVPVVWLLGCRGVVFDSFQHLTPEKRAATEKSVRQFASLVAHDVSQDGPIAWQKHFQSGPEFFMAVNGKLEFPSGQAAAQAIPGIAKAINYIELRWEDDLRVDVLTENLCVLGSSYTEKIEPVSAIDAYPGTLKGYFTGLAELKNGQWQFRDVHWSQLIAPAKVP